MMARNFPSLEGKAVVVTGGASGIGEAVVRKFVHEGARVAFIDINEEAGQKLANALGGAHRALFEPADLRDLAGTRRACSVASAPPSVRSASWSTTPVMTSVIRSRT